MENKSEINVNFNDFLMIDPRGNIAKFEPEEIKDMLYNKKINCVYFSDFSKGHRPTKKEINTIANLFRAYLLKQWKFEE